MAHQHKPAGKTAAFYDVDGTLIKTNVVHAYAYYAINSPRFTDRLTRTASLIASLPLYWAADKYDRKLFNDNFYRNYAGFSDDRLYVLGEELFDTVIRPNLFAGAPDLIKRSRDQGHQQILVTGGLDFVIAPLARYLEVDHWVANRLEFKNGEATGRLLKPMIAGPNKVKWIREYADEHGIDLSRSFAYADSGSDLPLLSAVGNPCAVNPDFRLKTTARAYQWPVLNLE